MNWWLWTARTRLAILKIPIGGPNYRLLSQVGHWSSAPLLVVTVALWTIGSAIAAPSPAVVFSAATVVMAPPFTTANSTRLPLSCRIATPRILRHSLVLMVLFVFLQLWFLQLLQLFNFDFKLWWCQLTYKLPCYTWTLIFPLGSTYFQLLFPAHVV